MAGKWSLEKESPMPLHLQHRKNLPILPPNPSQFNPDLRLRVGKWNQVTLKRPLWSYFFLTELAFLTRPLHIPLVDAAHKRNWVR